MAAVARGFCTSKRYHGTPVLFWEGLGWFMYNGIRYVQYTDKEFERKLYYFFGPLSYRQVDKRSGETRYVKFNPDGAFLKRCRESIQPQVLRSNLVHDTWIDERKNRTVALRNGLLDLGSGIFTSGHDPQFFNTATLPFNYDAGATCERFDLLLEEIWPDDPGARKRFLQYLGVVISGRTDLQKMLLMIGRSGSGKSTLGWLMEQMVSPEAFKALNTRELTDRFGLYPLVGKKLGIFYDARQTGQDKQIVPVLLGLVGEDAVSAEIKHEKKPWTGRLGIRLVYVANPPPALPDNNGAVRRRLLGLWFERSVAKPDLFLKSKLADELPGVFNRALAALAELDANGGKFADAPSANHLLEQIEAKSSPLGEWIEEECIVGGSTDFKAPDYIWTSTEELYASWRGWCERHGHRAGASSTFAAELRGAVDYVEPVRKKVGNRQIRGYAGIALAPTQAIHVQLTREQG